MRHRRSLSIPIVVLAVAAGSFAAPAVAAGPVIERIPINDEFPDDFLSEACGVDVVTRAQGQVITRSFGNRSKGPIELVTINVGLTATAGRNTVRFRDVGSDLLRRQPDGTLVLSISGQVPFDFNGVLKLNPETGEVLQSPQNSTADELDKVCARLTA